MDDAGDESMGERTAIPGLEGTPVFTLRRDEASPIPVVIAVPHAGRAYPPSVISAMRNPDFAIMRLEDRYVDLVAEEVARQTGAALLVAHAPRAMLDLNRAPDDVDWSMFGGPEGQAERSLPRPGRRARSGLGLVPRRLPGLGEVWKRPLDRSGLERRLSAIHGPYHAALASTLEDLRQRWGAALLLDLHSMPPLPTRFGGEPAAEFVIGDRFGASCDGALVATAFACLARASCRASHNRPYAGGYVLERHADTARGIHCLQLEVDRQSYLDARFDQPGAGLIPTADLIARLVQRLAAEVALLGSGAGRDPWAIAAE